MKKMPEYNRGEFGTRDFRFAVIVSRYNAFITDRLLEGALEAFRQMEIVETNVDIYRVPGSFELPQVARVAAETGRYDAIVCLGALLRGETLHFELISFECARGIQQVAADYLMPVAFGVITADTVEQATARAGSGPENKGWESAHAAFEMAALYRSTLTDDSDAQAPGRVR